MKKLATALLFLASVAVSLVALEVLIRSIMPRHSPAGTIAFYRDVNRVLLGRKNTSGRQWRASGDYDVEVAFNRHGFRDSKDLAHSTEDDYFVVGDSYSFGWGVEEHQRYSNLLQTMSGRPTYNISIPGNFNGYEQLIRYVQRQGATIGNLVIGVCMENDLRNYDTKSRRRWKASSLSRFKEYVKGKTAMYSAFSSLVHSRSMLKRLALRAGLINTEDGTLNTPVFFQQILDSSSRRLADLIENSHAATSLVAIIPSRTLWAGDQRATALRVHTEFVARLHQRGLRVVDLRSDFEAGGNPLDYHFEIDGHWNPRGHRLAAEIIHAFLAGTESS